MSVPTFHGKFVSALDILSALGDDLLKIKMGGKLKWAEIGEVLGVSEDQAAKYTDGSAQMGVVAYTRGRIAWNGKFTGSLDRLVEQAGGEIDGHHVLTLIFSAGGEIAKALEDGSLTDEEIRKARKQLEDLRAGIDKLLCRIGPRSVSA